jgi:hypothetical protein
MYCIYIASYSHQNFQKINNSNTKYTLIESKYYINDSPIILNNVCTLLIVVVDRFFNDLQEEQMKNKHEILKEVEGCCQRIWTSGLKLNNKGFYSVFTSFFSILRMPFDLS